MTIEPTERIQTRAEQAPDVPGYRVGRRLGRGASGSVWEAVRCRDQAAVALKVVPLRSALEADQAARELALLGQLQVEGLLGFHDALGLDGEPPAVAIVVDHVTGGSLAAAVAARRQLSVGESVTVLVPVARTLAGLHAAGVVHGDVSPANVLLESSGRPVVSDLGVARLVGEGGGQSHGTPDFVAPEVMRGDRPSPASDVYAVGALAWWCVTGAPLQRGFGRDGGETDLTGVPDAWRIATEFALSPDPQQRPSASELALAYFDSAACEPLRLVVGADDTSLLTQRLRRRDESPEPVQTPGVRRSWRGRLGAWPASLGAWSSRRWVWLVAGGVAAVGAGGVVVTVGWEPTPPVTPPTAHPAPRVSSGALPTSSAREPARSGDVAATRDSVRRDPRGLMQALADNRARAMVHASPGEASVLDVAGSAALLRDTTLLADLRARGRSYRDVAFRVRQATTVADDGLVATIDAVVDTSAYAVVDPAGTTWHAPSAGSPMRFVLRWQGERWRIERVGAP